MNILILDKISVVIDKRAKRHYLQFFFTFLLVELLLIITAHIIKNIIDIINNAHIGVSWDFPALFKVFDEPAVGLSVIVKFLSYK